MPDASRGGGYDERRCVASSPEPERDSISPISSVDELNGVPMASTERRACWMKSATTGAGSMRERGRVRDSRRVVRKSRDGRSSGRCVSWWSAAAVSSAAFVLDDEGEEDEEDGEEEEAEANRESMAVFQVWKSVAGGSGGGEVIWVGAGAGTGAGAGAGVCLMLDLSLGLECGKGSALGSGFMAPSGMRWGGGGLGLLDEPVGEGVRS